MKERLTEHEMKLILKGHERRTIEEILRSLMGERSC